jgi:hypothetical protein
MCRRPTFFKKREEREERGVPKRHYHCTNYQHTPTYRTWAFMIQRCTNPNRKDWKHYGGRGIRVCDRWKKFENFLADMGERPDGMTLDRIDNDDDYAPGNCHWIPAKDQPKKRRHGLITYQGRTMMPREWAEELGLPVELISQRKGRGCSPEQILAPVGALRIKQLATFNGKTQGIAAWAKELGVDVHTIANRANRGWPLDKPMPRGRPSHKRKQK